MNRIFLLCCVALVWLQPCLCSYLPQRVVALNYPPLARSARVQGEVDISVESDTKGDVVSTTIITGHPLLVKAVEKNLREWKFERKARDSTPTVVKYIFTLKGPGSDYPTTKFIYEVPNTVYVESQPANMMY